jgi:hypothetical protein
MNVRGAAVIVAVLVATPLAAQDRIHTSSRVNLRKCPQSMSRGCEVMKTLEPQTALEFVGRHQDWFQVRLPSTGEIGWVHSQYVTRPAQFGAELDRRRAANSTAVGLLIPSLGIGLVYIVTAMIIGIWKRDRGVVAHLVLDGKTAVAWVVFWVSGLIGVMLLTSNVNESMAAFTRWDYVRTVAIVGYVGWALYWGAPACVMGWWNLVLRASALLPVTFVGVIISILPMMIVAFLYSVWGGGLYQFGKRWWNVRSSRTPQMLLEPATDVAADVPRLQIAKEKAPERDFADYEVEWRRKKALEAERTREAQEETVRAALAMREAHKLEENRRKLEIAGQ